MSMNANNTNVSLAERKLSAREDLIYNLTEDLLVLLEDRQVTKADLAKKLGKSRSFVTQLLSGSRNMTLGTLSDICTVLDAKPSVRILPNGAKVLTYEESDYSRSSQKIEIGDISDKVVSLFNIDHSFDYQELPVAIGY